MSFCFYVEQSGQNWNEDLTHREITKIAKVIEVSAVNFPAYGGTNIDSRSLDSDRKALENARAALLENKEKQKPDYKLKSIIKMYSKGE
jgi:phage head maturation protease